MSCPDCAGRLLVSPCPLCVVEEEHEQEDMTAYEKGRQARICCRGREENPFFAQLQPEAHTDWLRGWDEVENEPE